MAHIVILSTFPPPPHPLRRLLGILTALLQLADAMAYVHSLGVIHGDLSRGNVLIASNEDSACGFDVKVWLAP